MKLLQDKIALITGAGKGIGRATAELFAEEGAHVVVTARTSEALRDVVVGIEQAGGLAIDVAGDVTSAAFVAELFQIISKRFGRLDVLVNNAGIAPFGPVEELAVEDFRRCMELNVTAVFQTMQAAVRLMKSTTGQGKIINIGSVRSHWTESGDGGAYNASKYALRGLTESVARQLHGTGSNISVGMVCPGVVDTTLTNPNREPRPDWLTPRQVAQAILHAAAAPPGVNVFDTTVFATFQRPW